MRYAKPHLTYPEQVALMHSRGLDTGPEAEAVSALRRVGYYRLSAYTYVLRQPGDTQTDGVRGERSEQFLNGASLSYAVALHDFDQRLRKSLLDGLQQLEVGFRSALAYQLGKTHPFGHLDRSFLDARACAEPPEKSGGSSKVDAYADWRAKYDELQGRSRGEDYVKHFLVNYDGALPIWAATEFMTMGCLVYLLKLLSPTDAKRVAERLQVKNREVLHGWLKALNVLRNDCAHNSRIWNRSSIYPPKRINERMVKPSLHHAQTTDQDKLYLLVALLAYLLEGVAPKSRWAADFKTTMSKFPEGHGMTPENMMGFPTGWRQLDLWATT